MIRPPFSRNHDGSSGGGNCSMAGGVQLRFCRYVLGRLSSFAGIGAVSDVWKRKQRKINGHFAWLIALQMSRVCWIFIILEGTIIPDSALCDENPNCFSSNRMFLRQLGHLELMKFRQSNRFCLFFRFSTFVLTFCRCGGGLYCIQSGRGHGYIIVGSRSWRLW